MFKKVRLSRLTLVNLMLLALFMGAFLSPVIYSGFRSFDTSDFGQHSGAEPPLERNLQAAAMALQQSYINVYEKASPSVVYIRTDRKSVV